METSKNLQEACKSISSYARFLDVIGPDSTKLQLYTNFVLRKHNITKLEFRNYQLKTQLP